MSGIFHSLIVPNSGGTSGLLIATDTANVDIHAMLIANGWDGVSVTAATLTIASTAKVYSNSSATPALTMGGSFPVGSTINIINNGYILGAGGAGGNGAFSNSNGLLIAGTAGGNGGIALLATFALNLTNNGVIGGGGGGGGGGAIADSNKGGAGGGGGGGIGIAGGGAGGFDYGSLGGGAQNGFASTLLAQGAGGAGGGNDGFGRTGFYGGYGGFYGTNGSTGLGSVGVGAGGLAGAAASGNANITWVSTGTIYGSLIP